MIPEVTSDPKVAELDTLEASLVVRENDEAANVHKLRAMQAQGRFNTDDPDARIALVLSGKDVPAEHDVEAQLSLAQTRWEAIHLAREALKPKIRAAKYEAGAAILKTVKPGHDKIMARLVSALVSAHEAHVELFAMSRELIDKEIGPRNGVCDLMPEVLGTPTIYCELADFFRACVKSGYLKALPGGFIQ